MRQMRWIITMMIVFMLLPIVVMAEVAGVPALDIAASTVDTISEAIKAGWAKIGWEVLSIILGVVSTVAITVITGLVYKYFGLRIDSNQMQMLQGFANQAINYAEQRAKAGAIDKSNRAQVALDFMMRAAKNSKLPNIAADRLSEYIESELGMMNAINGKAIPVKK